MSPGKCDAHPMCVCVWLIEGAKVVREVTSIAHGLQRAVPFAVDSDAIGCEVVRLVVRLAVKQRGKCEGEKGEGTTRCVCPLYFFA